MLIGRSRGGPVWLNNFAGGFEFLTSFQPPAHVSGATEVSNIGELESAIDSANDGDRIEIDTAGTYTLTTNKTITIDLTIAATVAGVILVGTTGRYWMINQAGKTLSLLGVEVTECDPNSGIVYSEAGLAYFEQCYFHPTDNASYGSAVRLGGPNGDATLEGCIVDGSGYTGGSGTYPLSAASASNTMIVRNCTVIGPDAAAGQWCALIQSGVMTVYNSAFKEGRDGCIRYFSGTLNGDYNAGTDATMPGANSHDNITWANYYNGSFVPQNNTAKQGGDTTNAADYDYYGNNLNDLIAALGYVPIGAIAAE